MIRKLAIMLVAVASTSSFAEREFYGCQLPQPGKEASVFLFAYDESQKGLLEGDSGMLAMWPYGKVPHKCGVTAAYDLTRKDPARSNLGVRTGAMQFTCQLITGGQEGLSISTITFTFDRKTLTLWNAVYSDAHFNAQVKDKYIASSVSEPRLFECMKLDPDMIKKARPEGADADAGAGGDSDEETP